jgi:hypothetical protein
LNWEYLLARITGAVLIRFTEDISTYFIIAWGRWFSRFHGGQGNNGLDKREVITVLSTEAKMMTHLAKAQLMTY